MAAKTFLLGRNAKAYYNDKGALIGDDVLFPGNTTQDLDQYIKDWLNANDTSPSGQGTAQVAGNLTDVSLNIGSDFADATTRATAAQGFASQVPVLKNGEVTFEMRWLPEDPAVTTTFSFTHLILEAWENDGTIAIVFLDQAYVVPASGEPDIVCQGLASNWSVSLEKTEALRDVQRASITLTVADSAKWYKETLSAP